MKTAALLATLFLATLPASARIGETLEQCRARYGPEKRDVVQASKAARCKSFLKNGFSLDFTFEDGKAVMVFIIKRDPDDPAKTIPMSKEEAVLLLSVNPPGEKWLTGSGGIMETEDHAFKAHGIDPRAFDVPCMRIFNVAASKRMEAVKAAEENQKLDGF